MIVFEPAREALPVVMYGVGQCALDEENAKRASAVLARI